MTELGRARLRADRHLAAVDGGEGGSDLGRQFGDRLKGDVFALWRRAHGLAEHLAAVRADVDVGRLACEAGAEHSADRDLFVQLAARARINRGE